VSAVITVVVAVALFMFLVIRGGSTVAVATTYPTSYVIVYQVTQNGVPHWEVLSVQRPWAASDLTYTTAGAPRSGDRASGGNMSTSTGLYAVDAQTVRLVSGRQPGPPSGDQFAGAAIAELTHRGLAQDLGATAKIAGRSCKLYRFAGPPSGAIGPLDSTGDHDDLCFDPEGLELSESWTYRGAVVLQRSAVEVRSSASAQVVSDSSAPAAPSTEGAIAAGASAATLTPDAHPSTFLAVPPPPSGFTASGPAMDFRFPDPQNPSQTAATSVVWAFSSGPRVITVEAGSTRGGGLPWHAGDTVTESVQLRGLGPATTALRSDGLELRVDLGGGAWVRVRGTVALDQLVSYGHLLTRASAAPTAG
jgi:hypothetical protein